MSLLPHEEILTLTDAATSASLPRGALLSGLDPRLVGQMPSVPNSKGQILVDLSHLNEIGDLADGTRPLIVWLQNAVTLTMPRAQASIFEASLGKIQNSERPTRSAESPYRRHISGSTEDRYELVKWNPLMSGSHADLVHAYDTRECRAVVIKMPTRGNSGPEEQARAEREHKALSQDPWLVCLQADRCKASMRPLLRHLRLFHR